jgi:hypothetical protein
MMPILRIFSKLMDCSGINARIENPQKKACHKIRPKKYIEKKHKIQHNRQRAAQTGARAEMAGSASAEPAEVLPGTSTLPRPGAAGRRHTLSPCAEAPFEHIRIL